MGNNEISEQELWKKLADSKGTKRADLLMELAQKAFHRNAPADALKLSEEATAMYLASGASEVLIAKSFIGSSHSLAELDDLAGAAELIGKAIDVIRNSQDPYLDDLLRTQARWYAENNQWHEALSCQLEAIVINELDGNRQWLARSHFYAARCYFHLSDYENALGHFQTARDLFKSGNMIAELPGCDIWIADTCASLGIGDRAVTHARRALTFLQMINRIGMIPHAACVLGRALKLTGEIEEAEALLDTAYESFTAQELADWKLLLEITEERAAVYRLLMRDEEAISCLEQALCLRESLNAS